MTAPQPSVQSDAVLIEAVRKVMADVFSQALGKPWTFKQQEGSLADDEVKKCVSYKLTFSGALTGYISVTTKPGDVLFLAQKFLGEEPNNSADLTEDHKLAVEELVRQVGGFLQTSLGGSFGEIKIEVSQSEAKSEEKNVYFGASEETQTIQFLLGVDSGLTNSLIKHASLVQSAAEVSETNAGSTPSTQNLALLLAIDLDLTLHFGNSNLKLHEILEMAQGGGVLEMDRQVIEPVDFLLGSQVVARGEVVIVDGNYGLRITEVPAPTAFVA